MYKREMRDTIVCRLVGSVDMTLCFVRCQNPLALKWSITSQRISDHIYLYLRPFPKESNSLLFTASLLTLIKPTVQRDEIIF